MEKKWQVFILVAVSVFMTTLDSSILNVALPFIMKDLSESMATVQWVVTVYLLFVSAFLLTFGRLSDIMGRPRIYRTGFLIFTLGSFFCGISGSLGWLVLSRSLQGLGASMLMACSPALIVDAFEPEKRGQALGLVGACVAAGLTLGPVTGGLVLEYFSWPMIFFINIPVGMLALAGSRLLPDGGRAPDAETMDLFGSLCMVVLVSSIVFGLIRSPQWGIFSWQGALCWTAGLAAAGGFLVNAARTSYPLIDPDLFGIRMFVLPLTASVILFAALFCMIFLMPFYLSLARGMSPSETGMTMIVPFLLLLVISPVSGSLADRLGSTTLCTAGMGCLALALALTTVLSPTTGFFGVFWRLALAGLGTALFVSPNSTAVMGAVPVHRRGVASGALATARNLGMVFGVALASGIFSLTFAGLSQGLGLDDYSPELADAFMTGFRFATAAGAVVAFLGVGVTLARGRDGTG